MRTRKHHNNKGLRQIKRGGTEKHIRHIAKKLRIPYEKPQAPPPHIPLR